MPARSMRSSTDGELLPWRPPAEIRLRVRQPQQEAPAMLRGCICCAKAHTLT